MSSALEIAREIIRSCNARRNGAGSKVTLGRTGNQGSEVFTLTVSGDEVRIDAESAAAAAYAAAQAAAGVKSGHISEFTGIREPRYPLRPLWLGCDLSVKVDDFIGLSLPSFLIECSQESFTSFCRRIYELGFNAVIFGRKGEMFKDPPEHVYSGLGDLCQRFHDFGIKVILKYDFFLPEECAPTPFDESYSEWLAASAASLKEACSDADAIFWTSSFRHKQFHRHRTALKATQQDLVLSEARLIEAIVPNNMALIYYLPAGCDQESVRQQHWLLELIDDLGPQTLFAFSAVKGDPDYDHLEPHPLWELLRRRPDISQAALMPMMNFGGLRVGEGLWPNIPFDLLELYLSQCCRHHFNGVIGWVNHLPKEGSLLDCSLWVAGQSLWRDQAPALLVDTWCRACREDITSSRSFIQMMRKGREVLLGLSMMMDGERSAYKAEECSRLAADLVAQLSALELAAERTTSKVLGDGPSIPEQVALFIKEAKRLVLRFKEVNRLPTTELLGADDEEPGFWTEFERTSRGRAAVLQVREEAARGAPRSAMEKIYCQNRPFAVR